MLLYVLTTLCITLTSGYRVRVSDGDYDIPALEWPERYTVKASKIELTTGLLENLVAWKANASSRVDYNHGAVKKITLMNNDLDDGDQYKVHPETTDEDDIELKCTNIGLMSSEPVTLDIILPELNDEHDYESAGYENILEIETVKFVSVEDGDSGKVERTVWAKEGSEDYDLDEPAWTPIRYEVKIYNDDLGALTDHYIVDYFDFSTEFDDDVFDTDTYDCDGYSKEKQDKTSDDVTKGLFGIDPEDSDHVDHVFNSFKNEYERQYADENEHTLRRNLFQNSMRLVASVNRKNLGYKLAINQFADRTPEEMKRHTGLRKRPEGKVGTIPFPYTEAELTDSIDDLPKEFDLRMLGVISPVKHQGTCGSCWTFGTTAAVEGALARVNGGRVMSLANQAIIDCAWPYGASGCEGGTDNEAYEWMMEYGLPTEEEYGSYANNEGYCNILNMTQLFPIKGYADVTPFSENALKVAIVNHGPLSVSVEVTEAFQLYSNGIYYEHGCGPNNLNHEVSLVGYGERDGELFWILKNSWGEHWGVDGYMYISARDNNCGVETEATYVVF